MKRRQGSLAARFRRLLLGWYRRHARPLAWRETRDPYRVLVSEFMLQQTQVSRVEEYYPRFLKRYPTIESLARAAPRTVRETWEGLGYYARAANLHRLANDVVKEHGGKLPSDPALLRRLPGIGRYTAGAVACFAYEKREPAVDTNVRRIVRRAFESDDPWAVARDILPRRPRTAWKFNQALMDLGATICVPHKPKCPACPVRPACATGLEQGNGRQGNQAQRA